MRVCPRCRSIYSTRTAFCGIDGQKLREQVADPLIGRDVGRYRVAEKLGVGSTGCVYKAVHRELETDFALKVLFGDLGANETIVSRFRREAQAASRIRSPYVVSVMDFGSTEEGLVYYVMEYSPGRTLQDALRENGALGEVRAARILEQVARGLEAAHALGFVHRDIKPANIVLAIQQEQEIAKILDFGIVRQTEDDDTTKLTRDGLVVGTPAYMSPEQAMGVEITSAADLYSLGIVLFEMLEGKRPFKARSVAEMVVKHSEFPPPPMSHHGGLERIAQRLLEKAPERRFDNAAAVLDAVRALGDQLKTRDEGRPRAQSAVPTVDEASQSTAHAGPQNPAFDTTNPPTHGQLTTTIVPVNRGLLVAAIVGALVAIATVGVALVRPDLLSKTPEVSVIEMPPPPPPPTPEKANAPPAEQLMKRLDGLDSKLAAVESKVGPDHLNTLKSTYLGFYKSLGQETTPDERVTIKSAIDRFEAELDRL